MKTKKFKCDALNDQELVVKKYLGCKTVRMSIGSLVVYLKQYKLRHLRDTIDNAISEIEKQTEAQNGK